MFGLKRGFKTFFSEHRLVADFNAIYYQGRIQKMNLQGANSGRLGDGSPPSGVQGRSPGGGAGGQSPPEADDFSQLKGYLDVLWRHFV